MRFAVKVRANARKNEVSIKNDGSAVISVISPARKGKANKEVIKLLAEYFHKPRSKVILLKGEKTKEKIFEIL